MPACLKVPLSLINSKCWSKVELCINRFQGTYYYMTFHVIELSLASKIWDEEIIIIILLHFFCEVKWQKNKAVRRKAKIWSIDQGYHKMLLEGTGLLKKQDDRMWLWKLERDLVHWFSSTQMCLNAKLLYKYFAGLWSAKV